MKIPRRPERHWWPGRFGCGQSTIQNFYDIIPGLMKAVGFQSIGRSQSIEHWGIEMKMTCSGMKRKILLTVLLGLSGAMFGAERTVAEERDCALALAFGLDVSVSVDEAEYTLQREGLAAALTDPDVSRLIVAQPGPVAMLAYEWSSHRHQSIIAPWHMIESHADLSRFAAALTDDAGYPHFYPTAIGQAIAFGLLALDEKPDCARRVLDISGDGANNDGYPPQSAYSHFPVAGVTVNGLVILGAEPGVLAYYETDVIYGDGAFVEVAGSFAHYEEAMKRKLLREVEGQYLAQK